MFDGRWREAVDRRTGPAGKALRRTGLTANQITLTGLVIAGAGAVAVGSGHLVVGGALVVAAGLTDLFDGPVAKAAGTISSRGSYLDSVVDRVTDSLLLGGVAWYLVSSGRPHLAVLALAVLAAAVLVSYERAKAESLGFEAKGGLMERAERMIALSVGLLFGVLLVPVLWLMLVLTLATALSRFAVVWRQAAAADGVADVSEARVWRKGRVDSRWRHWREASGSRSVRRRASAPAARWRSRRRVAGSAGTLRRVRAGWVKTSPAAPGGRRRRMGEALTRRFDAGQ